GESGLGGTPGTGVSHAPPEDSASTSVTDQVFRGTLGGIGLSADEAAQLFVITSKAGGAGGGDLLGGITDNGGAGGGGLLVLSQGAISIGALGVIAANGNPAVFSGSAGGAGGIIVLASRTSVTNAGQLRAHGGSGLDASAGANLSGSGGGGGGIIHLLAPA